MKKILLGGILVFAVAALVKNRSNYKGKKEVDGDSSDLSELINGGVAGKIVYKDRYPVLKNFNTI